MDTRKYSAAAINQVLLGNLLYGLLLVMVYTIVMDKVILPGTAPGGATDPRHRPGSLPHRQPRQRGARPRFLSEKGIPLKKTPCMADSSLL